VPGAGQDGKSEPRSSVHTNNWRFQTKTVFMDCPGNWVFRTTTVSPRAFELILYVVLMVEGAVMQLSLQ
jgi:hypothetical protein